MLLIAFLLVVLCCYFALSGSSKKSSNSSDAEPSDSSSYVSYLENKLKTALVNIEGVDNVSVTITLQSGFEKIYAMEEQSKTTASGTVITSSLVLVSGEPVLVKEIYPVIKGVVIITSSAKDIGTRLNILSATQTILEITNDKITILN